ncbi:MAG: hypothetical protein IJI47_03665 [Eubacterium sp.]|nr:hypothetical protein [Eubacterium sp.]
MKKSLSLALSLIMIFATLTALPFTSSAATVNIALDPNGGSGEIYTTSVTAPNYAYYYFPDCSFTPPGEDMEFVYWSPKGGGGIYYPGDCVQLNTQHPGGVVYLAIWKFNISNCTVSGITDKTYNGKEQTQNIIVKRRSVELVEGTDYTVEYQNNVNVGTATIRIKGIRQYKGTIEKTFKIIQGKAKVAVPKGKSLTYNGKEQTGVAAGNYTLSGITKATKVGAYTAKATLKSNANIKYTWADGTTAAKTITWKINKAANPLVANGKTATVKFANLKKKNQTVLQKNAFAVSKAQGSVTYAKASGNKNITVAKNGKITVKKGLKKNTYKIKVKVAAAGNANYKAVTKTVTVTIKVK